MKHTALHFRSTILCLAIATIFSALNAKTIVVNNQMAGASDANTGTHARPLKTIQAAANLAKAVTVE